MKRGQKDRAKRRSRRKAGSGSLVAHPVFAPVLGLWGALLAASAVLVIPADLILAAARGTFLATLGAMAPLLVAGLAAALLGGTLFVIASGMSKRARRRAAAPSVAEMAVRRVNPIDPARDLGSRSLDDPLDAMPFATPAWRDADVSMPAPRFDQQPEPQHAPEYAPSPLADAEPAPVALDLANFAEIPGRNAVWIDEAPAAEPGATFVTDEPVARRPVTPLREPVPLPEPGTAALARLRAVPPSELSLAEMVERFAGALHEHRVSPPTRALSAADLAAREAALAEALKALAALSGDEGAGSVREPLRAALAQFQTPRRAGGGAA